MWGLGKLKEYCQRRQGVHTLVRARGKLRALHRGQTLETGRKQVLHVVCRGCELLEGVDRRWGQDPEHDSGLEVDSPLGRLARTGSSDKAAERMKELLGVHLGCM